MLDKILAHPLTKNLSPDDPRTTELRRRIIREKPVLYKIYGDWYGRILQTLPKEQDCPGQVLELGAGGGFLKEKLPACICSEVFLCSGVDCVLDGQALPFKDSALRGIVMVDVLHHIPDPARFFAEAERVLHPGGVIAMLEPWNSAWSRIVYKNLHGEPFVPEAASWRLADLPGTRGQGPLSAANGALPWILFQRDYRQFERTFPYLQLVKLELDYPFIYLASGGVSMRGLSPGWSFRIWRGLEKLLSPAMRHLAMFALITIRRADSPVKKQLTQMKKTCLQMLPKSTDYASANDNDPLRFYYWPVLGKLYRRRVELCLELLPGGERVLEVGFGSGVSFLNLSGLYREIYGLDLEADCQGVSACFAARGVTAQLINGSVLELPYPDNFFDAVLLISILEHLKPEDLNRACQEIRRVLKPGGHMVYGAPVERPLMAAAFRLMGYDIRKHHFSTEREIAAAAGSVLSPAATTVLRGLGGLAGPVYEARSFINGGHDN